jgi:hypothetical protein
MNHGVLAPIGTILHESVLPHSKKKLLSYKVLNLEKKGKKTPFF